MESPQQFYHIYPLGLCDAPARNDFATPAQPRLLKVLVWIDHMCALGSDALYLGPVFSSSCHGYDTADFWHVDARLGSDETLQQVVAACHERGIRVLLDGVFHHVGRDFWAFRDLMAHGEASAYCDWFAHLRFDQRSPYGDQFSYDGWNGHYNLVKLNLQNPAVQAHLFGAVEHWISRFGIDGLRIDAADYIDPTFLAKLASVCRSARADFWLLGEVIHGDYRQWANPSMFDSVTNYEAYKGLYSSHNDRNYFELAYTLNRQFGDNGLYRNVPLYAFADNHDVNRLSSVLHNPAHLYPLHVLLFTMPGVPSIYYGSEWGIGGGKSNGDDRPLRPSLDLAAMLHNSPHPELMQAITHLAQVRQGSTAIRRGDYQQLAVAAEQLVFARTTPDQQVIVAVNAGATPVSIEVPIRQGSRLRDILNTNQTFVVQHGQARITDIPPTWARILVVE